MKKSALFTHSLLVVLSFLSLPLLYWAEFSYALLAGSIALYYVFYMVGMFIGNHKYWTHQSFSTSAFWETVMLSAACFGVQGHPVYWGKGHLAHHDPLKVDTEEDPIYRSRRSGNPFKAIFHNHGSGYLSSEDYIFSKRILSNPRARFFYKHDYISFFLPVFLLALGVEYFVYLWALPVAASIFVCGVGVIHGHDGKSGYVTYHLDDSVNIGGSLSALIYCGAGLENNHHKDPDNCNFAHLDNELDPSYLLVKLMETPNAAVQNA